MKNTDTATFSFDCRIKKNHFFTEFRVTFRGIAYYAAGTTKSNFTAPVDLGNEEIRSAIDGVVKSIVNRFNRETGCKLADVKCIPE